MTSGPAIVLVVDDDPSTRLALRAALELDGHRVEEASDGFEGIMRFEELRPNLVVLDMVMPGLDGFTTCRALRALPGGDATPILVTTGLEDLDAITRAYEAGATDFATKPVSYLVFRQRVSYMLRAARDQAALRASERRLREAQRIARLGHWEWDPDGDSVFLSEEASAILGVSGTISSAALVATAPPGQPRDDLRGALMRALSADDATIVEHAVHGGPRDRVVCQLAAPVARRDGGRVVSGTVQDVTERKRAEERIAQLAFYDSVTGLPNRAFLLRRIAALLAQAEQTPGAILSLDLDGFKRVNDSLGHAGGDALLAEVARRLGSCVRGADYVGRSTEADGETVARFGGDEFIVVLPELRALEDAAVVAERILYELGRPFTIGTSEVYVSASIGIAALGDGRTNVETLLNAADAAMYHAKASGRSRFQFYTESLDASARARRALEDDLNAAIERGQLECHYQPKIEASSGEVLGFEALVRWRHPTRGLVPPMDFIPLAEDTGLIVPIGAWVLRTALAHAVALQRRPGGSHLHMAVNVSSRQFREADFVDEVRRAIADVGIDPVTVELEITEGTLMDASAVDSLAALNELGVRIAIDDFGTGYSSLGYLRRFPIDVLKVDRSFVRDIVTDADSAAIVAAILGLAHRLRLGIVAEGVETAEQLAFLRTHGCDQLQGYFFSPPLAADRLASWLDARRPAEAPAAE